MVVVDFPDERVVFVIVVLPHFVRVVFDVPLLVFRMVVCVPPLFFGMDAPDDCINTT
ncbi:MULTISPECIES: hypothetical protein [unclassified Xanthobacter]|uniref:hypothetical protein n=1 Tax=unclassified Xanthobacter TaxID=2623496 RepID=UPI001EDF1C50|nr:MULTISPECIES: hypothetical protein [unclassified Xanthobacter]